MSASASAATRTVRVGTIAAFGSLPFHVAATKGFYKKNGLNVTVSTFTDVNAAVAALGKQYDVALASPQIVLNAASRGLPVGLLGGLQVVDPATKTVNGVLVAKSPITSYKQLEGKRIGVISPAGGTAIAVKYLALKAGADLKSIRFVLVPPAIQNDQIRAGNIDAAISAIPFFTGSVAQGLWVGKTDVLSDAFKVLNGNARTQVAGVAASTEWAASNPDTVKRFRKSMAQAMTWITRNPKLARRDLQSWLKLPASVINAAPLPAFSPTISTGILTGFARLGRFAGQLPQGSVKELVAKSMIPGADKEASFK
jgi:ABC-type nitrate/sulfonate/bicarbonate transport system substrate-binding protein